MDKKKRTRELIVFAGLVLALLAGCLLAPSGGGESESIQEVMRDAVLHEQNKVSLFGLTEVNPGLISAYIVTGILIVFGLICRFFVIPRFQYVPGKFQLLLEQLVGLFDGLAEGSSPHRNKFLRGYIFSAGVYIFVGTLFELLGVRADDQPSRAAVRYQRGDRHGLHELRRDPLRRVDRRGAERLPARA